MYLRHGGTGVLTGLMSYVFNWYIRYLLYFAVTSEMILMFTFDPDRSVLSCSPVE